MQNKFLDARLPSLDNEDFLDPQDNSDDYDVGPVPYPNDEPDFQFPEKETYNPRNDIDNYSEEIVEEEFYDNTFNTDSDLEEF